LRAVSRADALVSALRGGRCAAGARPCAAPHDGSGPIVAPTTPRPAAPWARRTCPPSPQAPSPQPRRHLLLSSCKLNPADRPPSGPAAAAAAGSYEELVSTLTEELNRFQKERAADTNALLRDLALVQVRRTPRSGAGRRPSLGSQAPVARLTSLAPAARCRRASSCASTAAASPRAILPRQPPCRAAL
jgi:hypothetical protein